MTADSPDLLTVAGGIAVAAVTGFFTWLGVRRRATADIQAAINSGFSTIVAELRQERDEASKENRLLRSVVDQLQAKVTTLATHIVKLEVYLRHKGVFEEAPKLDLMGMPEPPRTVDGGASETG